MSASMNAYAGTAPLAVTALRRDRLLASLWVLLLSVTVYASAAATTSLFPTVADRISTADAINSSPAIIGLYGPHIATRRVAAPGLGCDATSTEARVGPVSGGTARHNRDHAPPGNSERSVRVGAEAQDF